MSVAGSLGPLGQAVAGTPKAVAKDAKLPPLSFKPDRDVYDLSPPELHILNEFAKAKGSSKATVDDFLHLAAQGQSVKDIASGQMEQKVRDTALHLTEKFAWMDPSDFKAKVASEMRAMGMEVPEESLGDWLSLTGKETPDTQDTAHAASIYEQFGEEAGSAILGGTLSPELAALVMQRLDTPRYDQAMRVFQTILEQQPQTPGETPLESPNTWQVMASVLTAILAPKYAYQAGMTPYQFMLVERQRREQEAATDYAGQMAGWKNALGEASGMAQTGLKADMAEADARTTLTGKLIDLQKNRESVVSREAIQNTKNQTSLRIQQMKDTGKLTEEEAKYARQMLEAVTDPNTDPGVANSLRQGFYDRYGWDPLSGGPPIESYKADESMSRTALNTARVQTELERAGLTREQARKVATEADLLPQEFEFDKWAKAADIKVKLAEQRIKVAELDEKSAMDMAKTMGDARGALLSQAESLEKSAKDLDEAAAVAQDEDTATRLRSQADAQRGKAARARTSADGYEQSIKVVNNRIATAAPSGFDAGVEPFQGRYENGKIPDKELVSVPGAERFKARADVAEAMGRMIADAKKDGVNLSITDGYRNYGAQVDVKNRKPGLAATPGSSNHGWGTTFDLSVGGYGSKTYKWLEANASRFGFANPEWARQGGSKPEPWHWEYTSAQPGQTAQIDRKGSSLASGAAEVGDLLGIEGDDTKVTMALAQGLVKGVKQLPTTESPRAGDVALIEDVPGKKYRPMLISAVTTEKGQVMVTFKGGGKEFKKPASSVRMHVYRKS